MKKISSCLKNFDIHTYSYIKKGNIIIVDTNKGKYVVKKTNNRQNIYDYLNTRKFDYYPDVIDNKDYKVVKYIEEIKIPDEQRIMDLIEIVSIMHSKTTHYKEVTEDEYKRIFEDLLNNYDYLYEYYMDIISIIDEKVFLSPSEYTFSTKISYILSSLNIGKEYINSWLNNIEDKNKMRVVVVHNNLCLSHFISSDKGYLINFDKSKIDIPVFDLYILYNNHFNDFNFYEILKKYESKYPLKNYELELLFILILMPKKLEFNDTEYNMCANISNEIKRLIKSHELVEQYKKSITEN